MLTTLSQSKLFESRIFCFKCEEIKSIHIKCWYTSETTLSDRHIGPKTTDKSIDQNTKFYFWYVFLFYEKNYIISNSFSMSFQHEVPFKIKFGEYIISWSHRAVYASHHPFTGFPGSDKCKQTPSLALAGHIDPPCPDPILPMILNNTTTFVFPCF